MRLTVLVLCFLAGAAHAEDCKIPETKRAERGVEVLVGVVEFAKCIQKRVVVLETENAALREELDGMRKAMAGFPGELVNTNGRETRTGGERLTRASYSIASRIGDNASYLAIDDLVTAELCAQGCALFLQLSRDAPADGNAQEPGAIGPCTFRYDGQSGAWSLARCGPAVSGVDGDGKATGQTGGEAIITLGKTCLLADAEPLRGTDATPPEAGAALGRDRGKSLFLIADSGALSDGSERFHCDLKLAL